jgi:hypothetical protein
VESATTASEDDVEVDDEDVVSSAADVDDVSTDADVEADDVELSDVLEEEPHPTSPVTMTAARPRAANELSFLIVSPFLL